MLTGVIGEIDADVDHDFDVDHDLGAHADSDVGFQVISIQGITGLLMMFGLVGLMLSRGFNVWMPLSVGGALAAGFITLYAVARMMIWMKSMQSSGTINEKSAIGQEGEVYLTIPPGGVGKVHVTVQGRLMEYDAESNDDQEIKTGEQVRVVFIKGNNLIVEKF
jgi:membrane protein implicated in regulation of membrane protease activity